MMDNQNPNVALRAMAELETVRADIQDLAETLERIPLWRPAAGLKKSCQAALGILDRLAERLDRKLVITLVGPCGSGKSTLLNALAGVDDLSLSGHRRPTTQNVVAFCRQPEDARQLAEQLDAADLRIRTREGAIGLENVILIDTPDTDSTHQERHIPLVRQAIGLSDVLICVFDGENPKRRDHTDFLAPYVRLFSGSSLVVAVNKCDRLDEKELTDTIMPEFADYIRKAWSVEPAAIFCLSARSHLQHPGWDADAGPKHGRDQFDQLQRLIRETFNASGFSVDRRLENARSIRDDLHHSVREEAGRESKSLKAAMERIAACETEAMGRAMEAFPQRRRPTLFGNQRAALPAVGPAMAGAGGLAGGGLDPASGFRHRPCRPAALRQSCPPAVRGRFRGTAPCGFQKGSGSRRSGRRRLSGPAAL